MHQSEREAARPSTTLVALGFVVIVAVGGAYAALARYDLIGTGYLPRIAVFGLVVVLVANAAVAFIKRHRVLSRVQLAYVYIAVLVMAGFPGQQLATYIYLMLIGPAYYATPENRWRQTFFQYIPNWMVPSKDASAPVIHWAFEGMPEGAGIPWMPWVRTLAAWTPYLVALLALQLCVAALLRRRWADEEQLAFPLARIPVELMAYDSPSAAWPTPFRKPLFWLGFVVPVAVQSFYALHQYFPALPFVDLNRNAGEIFAARPWNQLNYLPYPVYFGAIGITTLIPTDIGFSLWFFWLARHLMAVARVALGYEADAGFFEEHGIGAYVLLAAIYLWMARSSFVRAARDSLLRGAGVDAREPIPVRMAFAGFVLSVAVIVLWGWIAGAAPWAVLLMLALYLAGVIVLTRLVSEAGILVVWTPIWSPDGVLVRALGRETLGPRTITVNGFMGWKIRDTASATMASILQGYRIGDLVKARPRSVFWIAAAALMVALFASHPASLETIYRLSVPKLGWWPRGSAGGLAGTVNGLITSARPYRLGDYGNMISGAAVVSVLYAARLRFPLFPLSPLAYTWTMGPGWASDRYGFSILLGWALKSAVLRGGGWRAFETLRFAALGIIVGDAVGLSLWTAVRYIYPLGQALIIE
jgi:hypothetical protein